MSVNLYFSQSSSLEIPFTMNKSLNKSKRAFGRNLKNNLTENDLQEKLALKPRSIKRNETVISQSPSQHAQMEYFDDIMKYAFTSISYPHILKDAQNIKKNVELLLHQVTFVNGQNCLWHENFMNDCKKPTTLFYNEKLTLQGRATLVDWVISIHKKYTLRQSTLHMTIALIDEYSSNNDISLTNYQLLGISSLFISAKYEQIELPRFKDYFRLVQDQYQKESFLEMESQILCKCKFNVGKRISALWYMEAFGTQTNIFGKIIKSVKSNKQNKQNLNKHLSSSSSISQDDSRYDRFMNFCRYVLNLVLFDYSIITKFKQDIIGISSIIFITFKRQFSDVDSKRILNYFINKKLRFIENNESEKDISRTIKKCMQKIQKLYEKRFENKFFTVNQKFNIDIRQ